MSYYTVDGLTRAWSGTSINQFRETSYPTTYLPTAPLCQMSQKRGERVCVESPSESLTPVFSGSFHGFVLGGVSLLLGCYWYRNTASLEQRDTLLSADWQWPHRWPHSDCGDLSVACFLCSRLSCSPLVRINEALIYFPDWQFVLSQVIFRWICRVQTV